LSEEDDGVSVLMLKKKTILLKFML